jgi:sodium/bile acid cotransporter 7
MVSIAISTLHCKGQPSDLNAEERRAAMDKMYLGYQEGFPDVPEIDPAALAQALQDDSVVLVDTREPREWAVSRISGAITQDEFEGSKAKYKDRKIVAYCTIGYRSGQFAKQLITEGCDASNLSGSILAWVHAGEPVVNDDGQTNQVHVYGPQWDLLPDGYESVW